MKHLFKTERQMDAMRVEMNELIAISRAVYAAGGEPERRLGAKCNGEGVSRTAVIKEWGDPRNWK